MLGGIFDHPQVTNFSAITYLSWLLALFVVRRSILGRTLIGEERYLCKVFKFFGEFFLSFGEIEHVNPKKNWARHNVAKNQNSKRKNLQTSTKIDDKSGNSSWSVSIYNRLRLIAKVYKKQQTIELEKSSQISSSTVKLRHDVIESSRFCLSASRSHSSDTREHEKALENLASVPSLLIFF